ncbi:Hypothetical predicted protein [Octopus vulgaris]|uniref:Uncharacterized protein n=1 Tax=Octopus vulgaris TaxID=6645 RepID=A0AA36FCG9_OCTVU|nr:Hypothetical predicted protein [Octopus vulgaris]
MSPKDEPTSFNLDTSSATENTAKSTLHCTLPSSRSSGALVMKLIYKSVLTVEWISYRKDVHVFENIIFRGTSYYLMGDTPEDISSGRYSSIFPAHIF